MVVGYGEGEWFGRGGCGGLGFWVGDWGGEGGYWEKEEEEKEGEELEFHFSSSNRAVNGSIILEVGSSGG